MSEADGKGRTRFIEHEGHSILLLDFSGIRDPAVALTAIAEAKAFIAKQPQGSLLTITYIKGSAFMPSIVRALQDLARADAPYVKAAVVAGMSGLQRVAFTAIKLVSGRTFKVCRDVEEAKQWLVAMYRTPATTA
jgi:hypothetical protein